MQRCKECKIALDTSQKLVSFNPRTGVSLLFIFISEEYQSSQISNRQLQGARLRDVLHIC